MITESIEVQEINDTMAKLEAESSKIKFKLSTYETLSKIANAKAIARRALGNKLEKDLDDAVEKVSEPGYVPTDEEIRHIAELEMYLEFTRDGIFPSEESIDKKVELVASRAIKVKDEMATGMFKNARAILAKLSGVETINKDEQQLIEGLMEEEAAKEETVEEPLEEKVEEVVEEVVPPVEEEKEDLEEKIEDQYLDLDISGEEKLKTGLTEEEVQSVEEKYVDIDVNEETTEEPEVEEEKEEAVEEETNEKVDLDDDIESLLKESDEIKQRIKEVADKRKAKEEEKAKAQKEKEEAENEKEMRHKALKEAIAKYKEKLNKDKEKLETETKSLEEEEKGIQELSEETKKIKDQNKKTNKNIELLLGELDDSEKSAEKTKKK